MTRTVQLQQRHWTHVVGGFDLRPMRPESLAFLTQLVNTPSPSGHEARGQKVWLDYLKEFADETFPMLAAIAWRC